MTPVRSSSLALVRDADRLGGAASAVEQEPAARSALEFARGRERRAFTRLDPLELAEPLIARVKYGESVRLVDVSAGGAQFETASAIRPDSTLVLEVTGAGSQEAIPVVSRVLRCHVSDVRGGVRYRGACVFKRPLEHPALVAPTAAPSAVPDSFGRPEFALKTIVEGYRRRAHASKATGTWHDTSALLESLGKLRDAAEQRIDPIDRRLAQMLAAIVPALQRNQSADDVIGEVLIELRRHIPALALRIGGGSRPVSAGDAERITLNVWSEPADTATLTAEFPTGFDVDEPQFRLLKAGAYLLGLAESWVPLPPRPEATTPVGEADPAPPRQDEGAELPAGWQRVVVRFVDGKLLRGYSNNFHPDAAHLHLSPDVNCAPGDRLFVPMTLLKAVFFVRDLAGNAEHVDSNCFDHTPRARKVEVTFRDDEVMIGSTLNYKPQGQGFYLIPANSRGNNQRVYVVLAAVRHLRFL
jgi:hypothetical protein